MYAAHRSVTYATNGATIPVMAFEFRLVSSDHDRPNIFRRQHSLGYRWMVLGIVIIAEHYAYMVLLV